jgi:hypothetical protein
MASGPPQETSALAGSSTPSDVNKDVRQAINLKVDKHIVNVLCVTLGHQEDAIVKRFVEVF